MENSSPQVVHPKKLSLLKPVLTFSSSNGPGPILGLQGIFLPRDSWWALKRKLGTELK
jgi:hypothetical protein